MSSPNQIYWSTIYNYFASNAQPYTTYPQYPLSPSESSISGTSDSPTASSPSSQSSVTTSPQEVEPALYSPNQEDGGEEDCSCGFDFCNGFCAGLPDDTESVEDLAIIPDIIKAGIVPNDLHQLTDTYNSQLDGTQISDLQAHESGLEEFVSYRYYYWMVDQEEQAALDAWVGFYLNAPDPQGSVDSIPCESEWGRRVWGVVTKKLREVRGEVSSA
jgi:hypothetical protein